ncbi:MAG: LysR family transcriptional regulator [Burkholderiaceae bacterium]
MELKWLEDFLALLQTRNFTSAAQLRNISQPAFS